MTEQERPNASRLAQRAFHAEQRALAAESRIQELEGELERERVERTTAHGGVVPEAKLRAAESRLARLEGAARKLERKLDNIIDAELPTLEDVEQAVLNALRGYRTALLTHSTPSGRQQLVEACQRAIRRGDKKVAEDLDRKINEMDSQAADD